MDDYSILVLWLNRKLSEGPSGLSDVFNLCIPGIVSGAMN
jgi:hypothetical protein